MAGIRELRGRIKSVGNIKQITRAMEMVATTKLRRFQDRAIASRPYTEEITALMVRLAAELGPDAGRLPLFQPGRGDRTAILLVSSDRGLCGAYNSNVFRELLAWRDAHPDDALSFFVIGRKGNQYLTKRGYDVVEYLREPPLESIDFGSAARIAARLVDAFLSGEYSEVRILYTAFESVVRYVPSWIDLLPVRSPAGEDEPGRGAASTGDIILEPDAATIFDRLVPRYLETRVYNAMIEAITSEYASRRVSMKNATDAATDMQAELKTVYNRKRQETITKDLLDIVGGAEALR